MLIREIGAHYEYSWRSISGKASMMKEAKPNWQQVDFPSESVTAVTATSEKEVDVLTRMHTMNERPNRSQGGILGAKKCHRCCLSTIVGERTTNQAVKKDKQAPSARGARELLGRTRVIYRSVSEVDVPDWKLVEFVTNLKLVGFVGFVTKLQTPWSGCRPRPT